MKETCKSCHWDYDLEDFEPHSDIVKIMQSHGLCFRCAFWEYQYQLDQTRMKEGIMPLISQQYYKTVSCSNQQSHYCLTLGPNNLLHIIRRGHNNLLHISRSNMTGVTLLFSNVSGGILTTEGYLFPYTQYSKNGGITHQGTIPVNVKKFQTNAKFLTLDVTQKLISLKDISLVPLTCLGFAVKVPERIIQEQFNFND